MRPLLHGNYAPAGEMKKKHLKCEIDWKTLGIKRGQDWLEWRHVSLPWRIRTYRTLGRIKRPLGTRKMHRGERRARGFSRCTLNADVLDSCALPVGSSRSQVTLETALEHFKCWERIPNEYLGSITGSKPCGWEMNVHMCRCPGGYIWWHRKSNWRFKHCQPSTGNLGRLEL